MAAIFHMPVYGPRIVPFGHARTAADVLPNGRPGFRVTQRFTDPDVFNGYRPHMAMDIGNYYCGDSVLAMLRGVCELLRDPNGALGVRIHHPNNWKSEYWHLSGYNVKTGQSVFRGRRVGWVGKTWTLVAVIACGGHQPCACGDHQSCMFVAAVESTFRNKMHQTPMTSFDPRTYWPQMGPWLAGPGAVSPEHIAIEGILTDLLPSLNPIHSVLDVGCGRGRLAALLGAVMPAAHYTGLDIGEAQTIATQAVRPDGAVYTVPIQDFSDKHRYDLVLVSEVLMHIPPNEIQQVCKLLLKIATKAIVLIEWTEPIGDVVPAEYNWIHDYQSLFGDKISHSQVHALQTIFLIRP